MTPTGLKVENSRFDYFNLNAGLQLTRGEVSPASWLELPAQLLGPAVISFNCSKPSSTGSADIVVWSRIKDPRIALWQHG